MLNFEKKAKWDGWKAAGEAIPEDTPDLVEAAKKGYVNLVRVAMGADEL